TTLPSSPTRTCGFGSPLGFVATAGRISTPWLPIKRRGISSACRPSQLQGSANHATGSNLVRQGISCIRCGRSAGRQSLLPGGREGGRPQREPSSAFGNCARGARRTGGGGGTADGSTTARFALG